MSEIPVTQDVPFADVRDIAAGEDGSLREGGAPIFRVVVETGMTKATN